MNQVARPQQPAVAHLTAVCVALLAGGFSHIAAAQAVPARETTAAAWAHAIEAAEKWNQPGVFTTLHGFEWTSAPGANNLHRTVVFHDNADRVNQTVPFSTFDSQDPAELWKYMDAYAKKTGGRVLAIPHNGNIL